MTFHVSNDLHILAYCWHSPDTLTYYAGNDLYLVTYYFWQWPSHVNRVLLTVTFIYTLTFTSWPITNIADSDLDILYYDLTVVNMKLGHTILCYHVYIWLYWPGHIVVTLYVCFYRHNTINGVWKHAMFGVSHKGQTEPWWRLHYDARRFQSQVRATQETAL